MISIRNKVLMASDISGITITRLAEHMGITQATLSARLKTGKFTQEELADMAAFLGCEYKPVWVMPDGTEVI